MVAMALASCGDDHVQLLLADAVEVTAPHKYPGRASGSRSIPIASNSVH